MKIFLKQHFNFESFLVEKIKLICKENGEQFCGSMLYEKYFYEKQEISNYLLEDYMNSEFHKYKIDDTFLHVYNDARLNYSWYNLISELQFKLNAVKIDNYTFEIEDNLFLDFVKLFKENVLINWTKISSNELHIWDIEIINEGVLAWDWDALQMNPSVNQLFTDFDIIEKFNGFLNWKIISFDPKIIWSIAKIRKYKNNLIFNGICYNPNLTDDIIIEYCKDIKWAVFSQHNPSIDYCFLEKHHLFVDFSFLAYNIYLKFETLVLLKQAQQEKIETVIPRKKLMQFHFKQALEYANIDWNMDKLKVLDFNEMLLSDKSYGEAISKKITDKKTILYYRQYLDIMIVAQNGNIVWDKDLFKLLLTSTVKNSNGRNFLDLLSKIKITKEALISNSNFFKEKFFFDAFVRRSDGWETVERACFPLDYLKRNPNIDWDSNLREIFNK